MSATGGTISGALTSASSTSFVVEVTDSNTPPLAASQTLAIPFGTGSLFHVYLPAAFRG